MRCIRNNFLKTCMHPCIKSLLYNFSSWQTTIAISTVLDSHGTITNIKKFNNSLKAVQTDFWFHIEQDEFYRFSVICSFGGQDIFFIDHKPSIYSSQDLFEKTRRKTENVIPLGWYLILVENQYHQQQHPWSLQMSMLTPW